MKKLCLLLTGIALLLSATGVNAAKQDKINICHLDKDSGVFYLLNINGNALNAHLKHGDGFPGGYVPGTEEPTVFADNCKPIAVLTTPEFTSPANGSVLTSAQLTEIDWTASTGTCTPITYQYQAFSDAGYSASVYLSGWLTNNKIPTPGTPAGNYYIRVRAQDSCAHTTDWSNDSLNPYLITIKNPVTVESAVLNYGPNGWGGWSCPTNTTIVSATYQILSGSGGIAQQILWQPGATTGSVNYPNTPFGYTYSAGETGSILQNDNNGKSLKIILTCMPD